MSKIVPYPRGEEDGHGDSALTWRTLYRSERRVSRMFQRELSYSEMFFSRLVPLMAISSGLLGYAVGSLLVKYLIPFLVGGAVLVVLLVLSALSLRRTVLFIAQQRAQHHASGSLTVGISESDRSANPEG